MRMATVTFHFNVAQPIPYLCRLLRQVTQKGVTAWVRLPAAELESLDQALWTSGGDDFLAHARVGSPEAEFSPLLLSDGVPPGRSMQLLVNVWLDLPEDLFRHERVVDIVGLDETQRQQARARWRRCAQVGHQVVSHDAASTGAQT